MSKYLIFKATLYVVATILFLCFVTLCNTGATLTPHLLY
jgi:hypothetical protein